MASVLLFNKPYGVLCQFTSEAGRRTLKEFVTEPGIYPAGRLDADSEGLVILTSDGRLQHRISDPAHKMSKTYLVQVEGVSTESALNQLRTGVNLRGFVFQPAAARQVAEPPWLWSRTPPIRTRLSIPTTWIEIVLTEGKNRQVRRMTAAVNLPTLRLIRYGVGPWTLDGIAPGECREIQTELVSDKPPEAAHHSKRQPFRRRDVIGRAIPHPLKRKKR